MHEASIAQSLVGIVRRAAVGLQVERVVRIELSIGRLKAIEPQLLSSCFQFMAENTVCEGAELVITAVPIAVSCEDCGAISDVTNYSFCCRSCNSNTLKVISGLELKVDRIQAI